MKFFVVILMLLAGSCGAQSTKRYDKGALVKVKITGQKGQVLHGYDYPERYNVRVVVETKTIINGAVVLTSTTDTMSFSEFELEPWQE